MWPPQTAPGRVDAVVVLSGDRGERLAAGLQLVRSGLAPVLVLDGTPDSPQAVELCGGGEPFEVVCLRPMPDNTRAEARAAAALARERGWRRIAVVTSDSHVTRAGLLFRRCVDAEVITVGARPSYGIRTAVRSVTHEWLGTLHAVTLGRGC